MHKRLVEHIKRIIDESPFHEYYIISIDAKPTGGFWSMKIVAVSDQWVGYLSHIERFAVSIGDFYSEGLFHEIKKRTLTLS